MKNIFKINYINYVFFGIFALLSLFVLYKTFNTKVEKTIKTIIKVDSEKNNVVHISSNDAYKLHINDEMNIMLNNKYLKAKIRSIEYIGDDDFKVELIIKDNFLLPGSVIPANIIYEEEKLYNKIF